MPKLLHISDLHFSKVTCNPLQIFSKRWIGNLNLFLFRKKAFHFDLIDIFLEKIDEIKPEIILISGDFTTTSLNDEYKIAQKFILKLKERGIKVFGIPGNHDTYTKNAFKKKVFYQYFRGLLPIKGEFDFDLENHQVAAFRLEENIYLVLVDASCYTSYFQSNGVFSFEIEQHLQALLESIPENAKIWITCHYPFFEHENPKRTLIGAKQLKKIIDRFSQIEIFFHGHTHRQAIADLRGNDLPLISDSGSLTLKHRSTFNLLTYDEKYIEIARFQHTHHFTPIETKTLIRK